MQPATPPDPLVDALRLALRDIKTAGVDVQIARDIVMMCVHDEYGVSDVMHREMRALDVAEMPGRSYEIFEATLRRGMLEHKIATREAHVPDICYVRSHLMGECVAVRNIASMAELRMIEGAAFKPASGGGKGVDIFMLERIDDGKKVVHLRMIECKMGATKINDAVPSAKENAQTNDNVSIRAICNKLTAARQGFYDAFRSRPFLRGYSIAFTMNLATTRKFTGPARTRLNAFKFPRIGADEPALVVLGAKELYDHWWPADFKTLLERKQMWGAPLPPPIPPAARAAAASAKDKMSAIIESEKRPRKKAACKVAGTPEL